jgi:hypothetical protein
MTGRFLDAAHFYRLQSSMGKPLSDGFDWRTQPSGVKNGMGQPIIASLNSNKADRDWADQEHHRTYGAGFYYFMTGDETAKDGIIEGLIDWHAHDSSGTLFNSRANGGFLLGGGILAEFLRDIGDATNESAVLNAAVSNFNATAKAELCLNGYPSGCSGLGNGISRTRGARWGYSGELWRQSNGDTWCGVPVVGNNRGVASFQSGIFIEGLLSIRRAKGPGWPDYALAGDLAYGMARWLLSEMYEDNASGRWDQNGFHYYLLIDQGSSNCLPGPDRNGYHLVGGRQTTHATWLPIYQTEGGLAPWLSKIRIAWQGILNGYGTDAPDYAGYQAGHVIALPGLSGALEAVGLTGFTDNGGGSYTLQWTVPAEAQTYRVKYSTTKQITDWLNFNKYTFSFGLDPNIYVPWFAATDASRVPAPQPEGTTQFMTIQTGQPGLTAANFSVKAMVTNPALPGNPVSPGTWTLSDSSRMSGGTKVE